MAMRGDHCFFGVGALLLGAFGAAGSPAASVLPNVLVILVDDAGYADFGFMGSKDLLTPHIDRLASLGTVFRDAHVTATVCSPSRAGLLTGRYQQRFGHETNSPPPELGLPVGEQTLGDVLGGAGYRTIAIGKWHLGERSSFHPLNRGFDEFYGFLEGGRGYFPDPAIDRPDNARALLEGRQQVDFTGYLTDRFTDRALEFLADAGTSTVAGERRPWFMYLAYNAVHTPMHAKPQDLARFAGHPRRELAAMTWSLDENVGRIIAALDASGAMDDTLIFFLSDNGGAYNNQSSNLPLKGWKGNQFEGGHRVPFVVTWKNHLPAGGHFDGLTSALDIFATASRVAGVDPVERGADGVDLLPYLTGEQAGDPHDKLYWRKDRMAGMRWGTDKLVRLEGYGYRMYDLAAEPGETDDVAAQKPARFEQMKHDLITWERRMANPLWFEGEAWDRVNYHIHQSLMDNREVLYRSPDQMKDREKTGQN